MARSVPESSSVWRGDGEDLPPLCPDTNQLDVAASLRDLLEAESLKDGDDITAGESPQFRHGRGPIPW
jgi:hypothetical protein